MMEKIKYNSEDLDSHYGVAAVIKNEKNEILVQNHVKYGFWTIPVGKVKSGQNIEQGLKQEIIEECDITITKYKELAVKNFNYTRDGKNVLVIGHLFEVLSYVGIIKNKEPEKHSAQVFISVSKLKKLPYLSDLTLLYLELLGFKRSAKI